MRTFRKTHYRGFLALIAVIVVTACSGGNSQQVQVANTASQPQVTELAVYKSPSCGCCGKWIEHLENNGFQIASHHPQDLAAFKAENNIPAPYQSCHTAISTDGYVFEGHIPARLIGKFLREKPGGAIGLAVPGMPAGSPGMEMGSKFTPYNVLLLKSDGSSEIYARVATQEEQY